LEPFLEPRWKLAAAHKLFFQPRRQPVLLGESWGKIVLAVVIPSAYVAVMVSVVMLALVVIISMFVVIFSVSVALSKCGTGSQHKKA